MIETIKEIYSNVHVYIFGKSIKKDLTKKLSEEERKIEREKFMKRLYLAANEDARIFNEKMKDPVQREKFEKEMFEIDKRAYETSKRLTKPGYIDRNMRYIG